MLKNLPTTAWIIGATVAVAALTPVVGQVATTAPAASSAATSSPAATVPSEAPVPTASASDSASPTVVPSPDTATQQVKVQGGSTSLGATAVDGQGRTLYLSTLDRTDPPASVCLSQECLKAWKPLYLPNKEAKPLPGNGVDPALLGSLLRSDGTWQATLGGWPLYLFDKDQKPGDALGEGLKGTWHVIGPDGKKTAVGKS
ncbi:hypothetical protein [Streptomyces sp. NPDC099088]|uniref:COG4315 family predicted lipoprotein n=1 Tax=Streptomyces sp. NPDC099088 TaxID=3366101 RepID=UPI003802D16A